MFPNHSEIIIISPLIISFSIDRLSDNVFQNIVGELLFHSQFHDDNLAIGTDISCAFNLKYRINISPKLDM